MGLGSMGDEVVRQVFRQVDSNDNGRLDMSEAMKAYELFTDLKSKFDGGASE